MPVQISRIRSKSRKESIIAGPHSILRLGTFNRHEIVRDDEDVEHSQGTEKENDVPEREIDESAFAKEHFQGLSIRHKLYYTLSQPDTGRVAKIFSIFILLLILLSSSAFIISTMPEFRDPASGLCCSLLLLVSLADTIVFNFREFFCASGARLHHRFLT